MQNSSESHTFFTKFFRLQDILLRVFLSALPLILGLKSMIVLPLKKCEETRIDKTGQDTLLLNSSKQLLITSVLLES